MSMQDILKNVEDGLALVQRFAPAIAASGLPVVSEVAGMASSIMKIAQAAKDAVATGGAIMSENDQEKLNTMIDELMILAAAEAAEVDKD